MTSTAMQPFYRQGAVVRKRTWPLAMAKRVARMLAANPRVASVRLVESETRATVLVEYKSNAALFRREQARRNRRAVEQMPQYSFRRECGGAVWVVTNPQGQEYSVTFHPGGVTCTCKDQATRGGPSGGFYCKHILMVVAVSSRTEGEENA